MRIKIFQVHTSYRKLINTREYSGGYLVKVCIMYFMYLFIYMTIYSDYRVESGDQNVAFTLK